MCLNPAFFKENKSAHKQHIPKQPYFANAVYVFTPQAK